ncbi:MAG: disulfide bond formation protein B [Caulobacterales bacterium]|nr:disulfide bond formation protein B [Caulobacterales bacterium]
MIALALRVAARHGLALALLAAVAMLTVAHAFETFGGLAPCHLCLQQREAYWVAGALALVGLAVRRFSPGLARWPWPELLVALAFAVGGAIAVQQAGAEWKWWPGPEGCSGAKTVTAADILAGLSGATKPAPRCDVAAWRMLGLSMAGWNAVVSAGLVGLSLWAAAARRPSSPPA